MNTVVCLRPEADFTRVGVSVPTSLDVTYRAPDDPELTSLFASAQALVVPAVGPKLAPELFDGSSLQIVQVTGAGVDRLDRASLEKRGIPVANVPGGSNSALAEYATASASTLLRRLAWASHELRSGHYVEFRKRMVADNLAGLDGLTVGVVGMGVVGVAVASAFKSHGCQIVYFDPAPPDPSRLEALGAKRMELNELLAASDVVTLHVPFLPATTGLIGQPELALMKPGTILIQAARGGIVDEAALADALQSGHLGGAAIDVYTTEPPDAANPLLKLTGEAVDRTILTPHIAGVTRQAGAFLFRSAWENVVRVLIEKQPPSNVVY